MGLLGFLNLPVFKELNSIIDPLTYLKELTNVPKYVIVASGDEVRRVGVSCLQPTMLLNPCTLKR